MTIRKHCALKAAIICLAPSFSYAADYYVAKDGNDSWEGSEALPFQTLAQAANTAIAGDTVYIRTGTYEETLSPKNSGTATKSIVFQSYAGEKVIISAMQSLSGWTQHKGAIYKHSAIDWNLGQNNFVMQGATAMDLARWPNNTDGDPFTKNTLRNSGGTSADTASKARLDYSDGIPDLDWSQGGSLYFYGDKPGSGWLAWHAFITSSTSTSVSFELDKKPYWIRIKHAPEDKGDFYLQGILGALDYQNEWYFDQASTTLYVQLPAGAKPNDGQISMRKRIDAINLNGKNHIHIKNLAVFGGGIELQNRASNNLISGVTSLYGNYTLGVVKGFRSGSQSINIRGGSDNQIEDSEIAFGAGTGIWDGGTRTQITNNYIHDFNYLGSYDAPLVAREGAATTATNNVITRSGRDGISSINKASEYAYNDVSRSNLIADDCALFYTVGDNGGTVIHHNWFHNTHSPGSKKKAAGIYLDVDSKNITVHHNIIWDTEWSGVQINWNAVNLDIHNNTIWDNSEALGTWQSEPDGTPTQFTDVNMWNNLSNNPFVGTQTNFSSNTTSTDFPFTSNDDNSGDYNLKDGATAIDAGQVIPGITDDVVDGKPDTGAYEQGITPWTAGVDWDLKSGPIDQCYGLPGESCVPDPPPSPTPSPTPEPTPSAEPSATPSSTPEPDDNDSGGGSTDLPLWLLIAIAGLYRVRKSMPLTR